jgi:hypothetical protein
LGGYYYISEMIMRKDDRNLGTVIIGFRQKRIEPDRELEIQTIDQLTVSILDDGLKNIKKMKLFLSF